LRLRNSHPAFRGSFHVRSAGDDGFVLEWKNGAGFARLDVNLSRMYAAVNCSGNTTDTQDARVWHSRLEA
jgi:hypothetical protein